MKLSAYASIAALISAPLASADEDDYISFIRQHQQDTGVIWDMPVELAGEALSPMVIETGGSLFQLWAIRKSTFHDYLIDQKLVGAYLPAAELEITTEDPYPVPRTRADRPFTLQAQISGLLAGPGVPEASTKVLLEHYAANYPDREEQTLTRAHALAEDPARSLYLTENGTVQIIYPATMLSGPDPTKVMGEEHFVVHALPDGDFAQTQIATAKVQIFPITSGTIAGIRNGDIVRTLPPTLTVTLKDLYPSSATYLNIYPGAPALGTAGKKIPGSILVLDQDKSQNRTLTVRDWATTMTREGIHTIELLTETPFGIERLDHVSFTVNRVLSIRAMVTSIE